VVVHLKELVHMPTKVLYITTRKAPFDDGLKILDHSQIRIHKCVVNLYSKLEFVKQIISIRLE
ncbi:unnamed protein product, partial [Rotaria sp. Silwood1]